MGSPTDDYLSLFFNKPDLTTEGLLTILLLGLFRIGPIVSLAPFLGSKLPGSVKVGLALGLTAIFIPQMIQTSTVTFGYNLEFVIFGLKELLIGFILAFFASIPFYIAQGAGAYIDFQRGSSSLQVQDPTMQAETSTIGVMFNYIMIIVFFNVNGPFLFLDAVSQSFQIVPIDKMIPAAFFNVSLPFWQTVIGLLTRILAISVQIAAPALIAILMAEMFLGIANRLAPQVQIVFLGMALKSFLGLFLLWAGWFFIVQQMGNQAISWVKTVDEVLRSFGV